MTGQQLSKLLFPSSTKSVKSGEKAAVAEYLSSLWGREVLTQDINGYLKRSKVNVEFLTAYAQYKGFDTAAFVKWAKGDLQTKMYTESENVNDSCENVLNEPLALYKTTVSHEVLKKELRTVFTENVALHQSLADRGNFILELLGE